MWVRDLAGADAACGGKAANLARLIAAGLPVPEGFAIEDGAFRAVVGGATPALDDIGHALELAAARAAEAPIPEALEREVVARTAALGEVVVRSSASIEDGAGGAAAGVFRSVVESDVWRGIRAVWASAFTPLAIGYARGRAIAIGVVIQRRIRGEVVTIYTRSPDAIVANEVWIQTPDGALDKRSRDDADPRIRLALRAEVAIGAEATGADVELVADGATSWVVQARPIVRRASATSRSAPPPMILAALVADGRAWTWDASHNPAPLSPAQQGLVELVDRAGVAPWAMRVVGGYLYTAAKPGAVATIAPRDLAAIEARLATALDKHPISLREALERYVAFYAIWATELSPLVAATGTSASERPSRVRALLEAAGRGIVDEATLRAELGDMAPAWDVAVPTYAETWDVVRAAIVRARARAVGDPEPVRVALAELDDLWFYRAQAMVRRALLARATALAIPAETAAWLPLDELADDACTIDATAATRRAAAARAAAARAAGWAMPARVNGEPASTTRIPLHGRGVGPPVRGRVKRFDVLAATLTIAPGDVVVCQTVTPALAVLVIGCAAIVSESQHDGVLDHGVALARELGITCVVGCHDAWSRLADGTFVTVDGAAGTVEIET